MERALRPARITPIGVRVVGQSFDGGDDRDWERGVAHDGLFPLAELARVGEVAVDERERGLCLGKKCE